MAAPAPSAGQDDSAASFIGALISLTSHSHIRYQGILASIDATRATLSLERVRSFGTEGRCAAAGRPQDEVAESENVFEFIMFRAADVVDLRIDDPSPNNKKAPAQPEPTQVRTYLERVRTNSYGCKRGSLIPAVRERFSHVDSSAAFLLNRGSGTERAILTHRH